MTLEPEGILVKILTMAVAIATGFTLFATPAYADQRSFRDAKNDVAREQTDIRAVKVRHDKKFVTVSVTYADLPKQDFNDSLAVWIDTNNKKKSPNYLVALEGFHTLFGTTSGWTMNTSDDDPFGDVACATGYKYDRKNNRMIFKFRSRCIAQPKKIRVAVTAVRYEPRADGSYATYTDHLAKKHRFTRWIKR